MFYNYKKEIVFVIVAFFIFLFAAIYITFPLIFHLGDLATGLGDELVIAWIQNWVIHSLFTNPLSLFEANLYFPYHNTLAYSDLHLISSILGIIPLILISQPIAVFNFTVISSLAFLGFSLYLLSFYLTKNFMASLLSGILVVFSPAVLDKVVHVQILAIEWVPLALLFFLMFFDKQKTRYLVLSLVFFLLQIYNSFMPGYFILFSYLIIFLYQYLYKRKQTVKIITRKNILLFLLTIVFIIPIVIPYYQVSNEFNYTRDIRDAIHFALQPEDLFYTSDKSRFHSFFNGLPFNQHSQNGEFKPGYLGFIFTVLTLFVLWRFIRSFKKNNTILKSFITVSLLGLILSMGPLLHLGRQTVHSPFPIPLPYTAFYYLVPGFQGFRNSARWEMLFILAMAIAIALILDEVFKKYSLKGRAILYLLLVIGSILEFNFPMQFINVLQRKDFPQIYSWLNTTPKNSAIIILPAYNWSMPYSGEEIQREYFLTTNFRKAVNGYTGFSPPPWQELIYTLRENFPDKDTIESLKNLGVNYIIVDKKLYDNGFKLKFEKHNGDYVINSLKENNSVKLIKNFQDEYVFGFVR